MLLVLIHLVLAIFQPHGKHVPNVCCQVGYFVRQLLDPVRHEHHDEEPVDGCGDEDEEGSVHRAEMIAQRGKNRWYGSKGVFKKSPV